MNYNFGDITVRLEKEIMFVLFFHVHIKKLSSDSLKEAVSFMRTEAKNRGCGAIAFSDENARLKSFLHSDTLSEEIKFWFQKPFYYEVVDINQLKQVEKLYSLCKNLKDKVKNLDSDERLEIKKITVEQPFLMFNYFNENFGVFIDTEKGQYVIEFVLNNKTYRLSCENYDEVLFAIQERLHVVYKRNRLYKIFDAKK